MTQTITRSYETYATARSVVEQLEASGVASADISLVGRDEAVVDPDRDSNAGEGAGIGAALGGAAGLLAGLGMIAIPGVGPVVAAGWLASTAAGAVAGGAAGGIVGAMTSAGVDERDAHYYAETVRRGGSVVSVRASDSQVAAVEAIMDGAVPIDMSDRRSAYEQEGWSRFDEQAPPYRPGV
ncbi:general stress protein [Bosea sp. (in: a-proteobacteria)]|uniref:general stress protein n=1 Tax=Bosea sp. (in: a-proteobacteria) TaxID=1871050 RepID=UPI002FC9E4EB